MTPRKCNIYSPFLLILPSIILLIGIVIYPLVYALWLGFHEWNMTLQDFPVFVGLQNYRWMVNSAEFVNALYVSITFTLISISISFFVGFGIALLLNEELRGISFYRTAILVPIALTPVVVGLGFKFMYDYELGIINYVLDLVGLPRQAWLGSPDLVVTSLALVDAWEWTPLVTLILLAGLQSLPREPFEAADIDGASWWQKFRCLTLPMMIPPISVAMLIRFMDAFRWFDTIYMMTKGGPGIRSEALSIFAWREGFSYFHMGNAVVIALFMLFVIETCCWIFIKKAPRGK